MTALSPRGQQLLGAMRRNPALLAEHEKIAPAEVDLIAAALVQHLRAWRPMALLQGGGL